MRNWGTEVKQVAQGPKASKWHFSLASKVHALNHNCISYLLLHKNVNPKLKKINILLSYTVFVGQVSGSGFTGWFWFKAEEIALSVSQGCSLLTGRWGWKMCFPHGALTEMAGLCCLGGRLQFLATCSLHGPLECSYDAVVAFPRAGDPKEYRGSCCDF